MNTLSIKKVAALMCALLMTFSISLAKQSEDKAIVKARDAAVNASPDDWHTLASSAEKCIVRKANLKEANEWLDRSIEIKPTAYNLSLKGDYYALNKLPEKALEYYVKAMTTAKGNDNTADITDLQKKIAKITNIGG